MAFFVHIFASKRSGTLHVGSTDDLARRIREHREKVREGFMAKPGVDQLVWREAGAGRKGAL